MQTQGASVFRSQPADTSLASMKRAMRAWTGRKGRARARCTHECHELTDGLVRGYPISSESRRP